jgi:hypothetical protein
MNSLHRFSRWERIYCPDVRFRNEAQTIRNVNGKLIRVKRSGYDTGSHDSERDLDSWSDWDMVVQNDGSLADLYDLVEYAIVPLILEGEE